MPGRSWIYLLLVTGCSINYVDRIVLSVAAQPIVKEFGLSTIELGYLFSAFLWSYLVFVLPWGMYVDKVGTRRSTAAGMAIWSAATVLTGFSWNFVSMFISRLIMGFGESSTYPAGGRVIREWMPAGERGFATTVFNCGGYVGPALGLIMMSYLVAELGWRGAFFAAGTAGFLWLIWWTVMFRQPEEARFIAEDERRKIIAERGGKAVVGQTTRISTLMKSTSMWGLFITQGCAVYTVYLFLTWLPTYLQATRGLSMTKTGFLAAIPYAVAMIGTISIGALSDHLLKNSDVTSGRRRILVAIMLLCSSIILVTPFVSNTGLLLALFSLSLTCVGSSVGLNITLTNDLLQNPGDAGRVNGFLVTGGNLFGVLAPIATGYVISGTGSYDWAFVAAGLILLIGASACLFMTRHPIKADAPQNPDAEAKLSPMVSRA